MLTEIQIDKLIQPVLKKQRKIELEVIRRFGEKIKQIKEVDKSSATSLIQLRAVKVEAEKLQFDVNRMLDDLLDELLALMLIAAVDSYNDSRYLYEYRALPFINFTNNSQIQTVIANTKREFSDIFNKLFGTPGFIMRDLKNPQILYPTQIVTAYQSVVDEAVQSVQNDSVDFDVSMKRTEQQLIDSGLNGMYRDPKSGKVFAQRLDTAVRNNLLDGINVMQQAVQDEVGIQTESDGKELSAHHFSALDHEPFQGHQFTNENYELIQSSSNFEDIQGNKFVGVERIIGVWNCRHYFTSIIIGVSEPQYSQIELDRFIEENHAGYTLSNGTHLTMYECTQRQRKYEAAIRQAREGLYLANITDNKALQNKYRALIADRTANYEAFCTKTGLPIYTERTKIVTK